MSSDIFIWAGILFCITQSAMFSGLNLAFFSLNRLQLEVEASHGNKAAARILAMRKDSNFLLSTILWGNVGINVLLTLLSDSVLAGLAAFLFSTVFITMCGEILPQAYFSRNALKMASLLSPIMRFYQILLFPVAKPAALLLDGWLGKEGTDYLLERDLKRVIRKHVEAEEAEVDQVEGIGALNFLAIDDLKVSQEGEKVAPESIICLPTQVDLPIIPEIKRDPSDSFLQKIHASGHNWVVLANEMGEPHLLMDADGALRAALFDTDQPFDPYLFCHRPIIVKDPEVTIGDVIIHLKANASDDLHHDSAIEFDVVLVWCEHPRIITGADILGRLLKGITAQMKSVDNVAPVFMKASNPTITHQEELQKEVYK
ncbi:MAG: Mg2+ and Co2+ transporter CorB [Gammaproteobacteria bacterium]|nr:MAG: Mg2+ and Co2+ transporter CorB [Pseudomonadota bacterium]PIE38306.1 MAG: Mg2+ and Co2+ transporter CorB [Gammaproteobacteria bacterium]